MKDLNTVSVWEGNDICNMYCGERDTHTPPTSICPCRMQYGSKCTEESEHSVVKVYHDEEDIMNRIRCRKSILSTEGSTILRLKYPQGMK